MNSTRHFLNNVLPIAGITLLFLVQISCTKKNNNSDLDFQQFIDPPTIYQVHTWWHWMDGAITREGITRDLESMKEQGISQATILNIGLFQEKDFGVSRVIFDTEQWYAMFRWALEEASRLGITIGAHNCDGWSTSGGPWITPEMSMKQYTWSKMLVQGGSHIYVHVPQPYAEKDFYKDVAVIAYPADKGENSFKRAKPIITINDTIEAGKLADANPVSAMAVRRADLIQFQFREDFQADKIAIHPRRTFAWTDMSKIKMTYTLQASDDGEHFRKIADVSSTGMNTTFVFDFPATTAKYFRVLLADETPGYNYSSILIGEIELIKQDEEPSYSPAIPYHLEKTISVKASDINHFYLSETPDDGSGYLAEESIINLTGNMDSAGYLEWDAPEGEWYILRFGFTTTGTENGPATREGTGLECDKMDTASVNLHFNNYPKQLINQAGDLTGSTFKFLLIDSWECLYQNWTDHFEEAFQHSSGYNILPWIPVLCGETVGDITLSEAFLYDFRKTIAILIENNYYRHFKDLCRKNRIELHAEVIYGNTNYPPIDILKTNAFIDLPMFEFWAGADPETVYPQYDPSPGTIEDFPTWAVTCYEKPILGAEAYTGFAHYSESPANLKSFGDRAFCSGINQMILHSYVHQPLEEKPGMTLGPFASHFNRHNPWWNQVSGWMDYHARIQYVLQNSTVVSDILFYLGDQLPQSNRNHAIQSIPFGYKATACNFDILNNRTSVKHGKIILSGKQEYSLLVLPDQSSMELSTLKRIAVLVENGAVIYGNRPENMLSMASVLKDQKHFQELVNSLWGEIDNKETRENPYGKGKVIWGKPLAEVLNEIPVIPQFTTNKPDPTELIYIHKSVAGKDVFFVFNQQNRTIVRECLFRTNGELPEIWNPMDSHRVKPAIYTCENGQVRIPVSFKPRESLLFVFEMATKKPHIIRVNKEGKQVFPMQDTSAGTPGLPCVSYTEKGFEATCGESGNYTFTTSEDRTIDIEFEAPEILNIHDFQGRIDFEPAYRKSIESQEFSELKPLTDFDRKDIKYFAGIAMYTILFDKPEGFTEQGYSVLLNLGDIEAIAEVSLNGKRLGNSWLPGSCFEVSGLIQDTNQLEVVVTTAFRNRIIGDYKEFGELQNVWTSTSIHNYLSAETPLKPCGLMGPLELIKKPIRVVE